MQFRALRSEYQTASAFAAQEAEFYGAKFAPRQIDKSFAKEREAISTFLPKVLAAERHSSKMAWEPEWKMPGTPPPLEEWTRGTEYAERLEKGVRPIYTPDLEAPPEMMDVPRIAEEEVDQAAAQEKAAMYARADVFSRKGKTYNVPRV